MRVILMGCLATILVAGTAFATEGQSPEMATEPAAQAAPTEATVSPTAEEAPAEAPSGPVAETTAEEAPALPVSVVARATFTTGVVDREPVDTVESLTNDHDRVFFFSEIQGPPGQVITHRWEYKEQVMAEVSFEMGGRRWRVYSSKRLIPGWIGDWTVVVVDGLSNELGRYQLKVVEAPPPVGEAGSEARSVSPSAPDEAVEIPEPSVPAPGKETAGEDTRP